MTRSALPTELEKAIQWAISLRSSNSSRWPTHLEGWAIGELVIVVLNAVGHATTYQREWNPVHYYPQTKQVLVASIFHVDLVITVVLAEEFEYLLGR